ncbi:MULTISPECIES: hypothetical protein [Zobellia]|uniref:hypothetical protein n=1 Tax=Zobellia TaxID=112040 RepID=UPI000F4D5C90|nr:MULTISPECIES: hypothetical protein [Zobellia]
MLASVRLGVVGERYGQDARANGCSAFTCKTDTSPRPSGTLFGGGFIVCCRHERDACPSGAIAYNLKTRLNGTGRST